MRVNMPMLLTARRRHTPRRARSTDMLVARRHAHAIAEAPPRHAAATAVIRLENHEQRRRAQRLFHAAAIERELRRCLRAARHAPSCFHEDMSAAAPTSIRSSLRHTPAETPPKSAVSANNATVYAMTIIISVIRSRRHAIRLIDAHINAAIPHRFVAACRRHAIILRHIFATRLLRAPRWVLHGGHLRRLRWRSSPPWFVQMRHATLAVFRTRRAKRHMPYVRHAHCSLSATIINAECPPPPDIHYAALAEPNRHLKCRAPPFRCRHQHTRLVA